eukprot:5605730-Amphidinium_carterae.1
MLSAELAALEAAPLAQDHMPEQPDLVAPAVHDDGHMPELPDLIGPAVHDDGSDSCSEDQTVHWQLAAPKKQLGSGIFKN